jgi:hypothetical protein
MFVKVLKTQLTKKFTDQHFGHIKKYQLRSKPTLNDPIDLKFCVHDSWGRSKDSIFMEENALSRSPRPLFGFFYHPKYIKIYYIVIIKTAVEFIQLNFKLTL